MRLTSLGKYLPGPLLFGLLALGLFAAGRCTAPSPAKPSQDSTQAAQYADSIRAEVLASLKRDTLRASHVDSTVGAVDKHRAALRPRLQVEPKPLQPVSTAPDSIEWLQRRVARLEVRVDSLTETLDSVLTADSLVIADLRGQFEDQRAETGRMRGLLAGAADSVGKLANRLGEKDRTIHRLKSDRWSLCAAGGVGSTVGLAATPEASGPGAAIGGTLLVGACYRIW